MDENISDALSQLSDNIFITGAIMLGISFTCLSQQFQINELRKNLAKQKNQYEVLTVN